MLDVTSTCSWLGSSEGIVYQDVRLAGTRCAHGERKKVTFNQLWFSQFDKHEKGLKNCEGFYVGLSGFRLLKIN